MSATIFFHTTVVLVSAIADVRSTGKGERFLQLCIISISLAHILLVIVSYMAQLVTHLFSFFKLGNISKYIPTKTANIPFSSPQPWESFVLTTWAWLLTVWVKWRMLLQVPLKWDLNRDDPFINCKQLHRSVRARNSHNRQPLPAPPPSDPQPQPPLKIADFDDKVFSWSNRPIYFHDCPFYFLYGQYQTNMSSSYQLYWCETSKKEQSYLETDIHHSLAHGALTCHVIHHVTSLHNKLFILQHVRAGDVLMYFLYKIDILKCFFFNLLLRFFVGALGDWRQAICRYYFSASAFLHWFIQFMIFHTASFSVMCLLFTFSSWFLLASE